ncbi:helix-hairpin-helix domain-containing protein [Kocuria sp. NPDC057446]|uniref:helix-hairpin-helix domain-containing protein n=1 Tax=Kocuria sp. NPDC057446 TaxID=3346137 RepID=UPI0036C7DCA9
MPRASADADRGQSAAAPQGDRLAALLAEAGAPPAARGRAAAPGDPSAETPPGHRWPVAARTRTRVPGTLLLIALAALAWLAWTVLGPGRDAAPVPGAAGRPVLAEAELDAAAEPGPEQAPPPGAGPGHAAGAGTGTAAAPGRDAPETPPAPTPSAGSTVYVHVTGEVTRPGVVSVPAGARVVDAVEAAGGLTDAAVTAGVNLAAPVSDGQQVLVPDSGTAAAPGDAAPVAAAAPVPPGAPGTAAGPPGAESPAGAVNLNTATAAELETLPRVGPVLAGRIVEFREQHGGFTAVADLDAVPGIGPALMESLGPLVSV